MQNLSLYQMTDEWQHVFELLCDPDVPEEAVFDTIEMIEADMDTKADNYAGLIRSLEGDVDAIDKEIHRLQDRRDSIKNRVAALKDNLERMMRATGRTKFKTSLFSFSIQKNGGVLPVRFLPEATVPNEWRKPGEPDTTRIRKYLELGNHLPFAELGERGESLRIR